MSGQVEDRDIRRRLARPRRTPGRLHLHRRAEAWRSVPPHSCMADGFGIHAKFLGSFRPDPLTGQVSRVASKIFRRFHSKTFELHLFASDSGPHGDAHRDAGSIEVEARFLPLERHARRSDGRLRRSRSTTGPDGARCARVKSDLQPRLAGRNVKSGCRGLFATSPSARSRRRGPVPRRPHLQDAARVHRRSCAGSRIARRRSIAAAAQNPGRSEQIAPSCPAR